MNDRLVVNDPLEASSFELVHARLLLEHLPQRDQVLQKLVRALRPRGWLVVEDVDYVSGVPISDHGAGEHKRTRRCACKHLALKLCTNREQPKYLAISAATRACSGPTRW